MSESQGSTCVKSVVNTGSEVSVMLSMGPSSAWTPHFQRAVKKAVHRTCVQPLVVDCANGVGASKLQALCDRLAGSGLALELLNTGTYNFDTVTSYVQLVMIARRSLQEFPLE